MKIQIRLVLMSVAALLGLVNVSVKALADGPFDGIPTSIPDVVNRIGDLSQGPILYRPSSPPMSQIDLVTPPSIDQNGQVYSGSGSGGDRGQVVGHAVIQYAPNGFAWWVANYRNIYGSTSPVRAPQFDRHGQPGAANLGAGLQTGSLSLVNDYRGDVTVRLYHPQMRNRVFGQWTLRPSQAAALANGGTVGSDWGIQVVFGNGVTSPVRYVGQVAQHDGNQFRTTVSRVFGN